jgi:hypothetical protein
MISDITIIDDRAKKIRSLLEENGDTKKWTLLKTM